tara:strand:- start:190 stop:1113 length:924 start_codon:yes stop_codon:yes gene_type:complete
MKLKKPNFWKEKNIFSYSLLPFTLIANIINFFKKINFQKNFNIKTICVGNIYIGGTGKTSLTIEINKFLSKKFKTVFVKKNYENQIDEINLLKRNGQVISRSNRSNSLKEAVDKKFQVALLDDGLQQKNIKYDVKIVCFNSSEGIGNGFLLPSGPLRENLYELKKYDVAFLIGEKNNKKLISLIRSINNKIKIFKANYVPVNLININKNKNYFMFCGIGNPHEFINTLKKINLKIKKYKIFPDHYKMSTTEIKNIKILAKKSNLDVITTEKDYLRIDPKIRNGIKFLKVNLNINKKDNFKKFLKSKL